MEVCVIREVWERPEITDPVFHRATDAVNTFGDILGASEKSMTKDSQRNAGEEFCNILVDSLNFLPFY